MFPVHCGHFDAFCASQRKGRSRHRRVAADGGRIIPVLSADYCFSGREKSNRYTVQVDPRDKDGVSQVYAEERDPMRTSLRR